MRPWFRGFGSFRSRVFWSVVPIVVSFLVFQGWMNVREHRRLVTEEFEKRGRVLAATLGFTSELGVFSEDKQLLETAMRVTLRNPDVAYVVIQGDSGKVLASSGQHAPIAQSLGEVKDQPLSRSVERDGRRFIEFVSPIVSEASQTPDDFLFATRATSGGKSQQAKVIGGVRLGLSLAGVEEQVRSLAKLWGGITLAFLIVSAFVVYGFSRRITNPIKQLTQQAQKIAAGLLETRIPVKSRDEIGQLATAFNRMTGALEVSMSDKERALTDLQELNRTLEDRIRQRTAEVEERSKALERSLEEVRAMGEVSRAIGASLDLSEVLNTIATHALRFSGASACGIFELEAARERLAVVASVGLGDDVLETFREAPMPVGDGRDAVGPIGQALTHGQVVQVPDMAAADTPDKDRYLRAGFDALLAVPMGSGDVSHVMVMYRREPGPWSESTVTLLSTLANQSRVAIDNARLFKELEDKSRQLESASRHKSDFLANVSHELRTPMNAILGFNEMILDQVYGEIGEDLKRPLTDIQQSGRHLLRLINDVLDLSKIEAGRMELAPAEYSVPDTVEAVRSSLASLAAEKGLQFMTNVSGDLPLAYGDSKRITQCLMNLAGNALKFTKEGQVEIAVDHLDGTLRFRVVDTGIGIPREQIDGLFAEFQQADATIAREFGGTGLGLSIAKKFVEMHGGRIWVESEFGRGSTFFFSVPLRLDAGRVP